MGIYWTIQNPIKLLLITLRPNLQTLCLYRAENHSKIEAGRIWMPTYYIGLFILKVEQEIST